MPRYLAAAALLLSLICVANSEAQQVATSGITKTFGFTSTTTSFNGVDPRNITFTPINTTGAMRSFNTTNMIRPTNTSSSPLNIANIFRSFSLPSWPPKIASAPIVPQKQNQFQPNLPSGRYTYPPAASQK